MKNYLKYSIIVITCLIFLYAFSSSYNSQNIDHLDYVIALCVDSVPDTLNLKVSFEFANLNSFSENSSSKDNEPIINSIIAPSIPGAINIMNGYLGKQLNLSHCKVIVFSKEIASRGIHDEVSFLTHNIQIRPTTNIVISEGEAVEYARKSISSIEQVLTKYYDLFPTSSEYTGFTSNVPLGYFHETLFNKDIGAVALLGKQIPSAKKNNSNSSSTNEDSNSQSSSNTSSDKQKSNILKEASINVDSNFQSIDPQKAIVEGDHGTENMGLAVFKDDKYIGELSTNQTLCYSLINDEVENFLITLINPLDKNEKIDIYTNAISKARIDIDVSKQQPVITIGLNLSAKVLSYQNTSELSYAEILDSLDMSLKNYLSKELLDYLYKTSHEYKCDINGFYKIAKRNFLTNTNFENYNWANKYENAEFKIDFNKNIISTLSINST